MPNTAEDDALTQALIAQLMLEDLRVSHRQYSRPIGSSAEDYEHPVFDRGQLEGNAGEDGTGWENEHDDGYQSGNGSGDHQPAPEQLPNLPAIEYPGGWDSGFAFSGGSQPAATDEHEYRMHKKQKSNPPDAPATSSADNTTGSDPMPPHTVQNRLPMSVPETATSYGTGKARHDISPTAEQQTGSETPPLNTASSPAPDESNEGLINVWGPEDIMDMDIDTSSAKNKGKARALPEENDNDDNEETEEDDENDIMGPEYDFNMDEPDFGPTARDARRSALLAKLADLTAARLRAQRDIDHAARNARRGAISAQIFRPFPDGEPSRSGSEPVYRDEGGNEMRFIHIPWPGSERDEIVERAEDNEVVEIRLGEEETLDSILLEMSLRNERRERGMVAC